MADDVAPESTKKKRGKVALLVPVVILVAGLAGGGYFFLGSKSTDEASETTTTTELGRVVRLSPLTVNLSDGRVLKVGIALQTVAEPKDEEFALALEAEPPADGAGNSPLGGHEVKALDEAIRVLGDKTYDELSQPGARAKARDELSEKVSEVYEGDVVGIYFTEFVMA